MATAKKRERQLRAAFDRNLKMWIGSDLRLGLSISLCLTLLSLMSSAKIDNQAISEYKFDLGASYGLNGNTEISHDNLQNIIKGAQQGNKGQHVFHFLQHCCRLLIVSFFFPDNIYFLGLLKLYGISLTRNEEAAAEYFRQAADLGLADAQTAYGIMLVQGLGNRAHYHYVLYSIV